MDDTISLIGKEHRQFINEVVEELTAQGIPCGQTTCATEIDADGHWWPADVIAKRKKGLAGYLPLGLGIDTSQEGVLLRMYDALHSAATDPRVREVVLSKADAYFAIIASLATAHELQLRSDKYNLDTDMRHGETVIPQQVLR